jgi:beta-phosphoglucomutase
MIQYAVIFDMDGVIAHTNPYHADAFRAFFDRHNVSYTEQELIDHMYGKHNSYIMKYFFKREIPQDEFLRLEDEKEGLFREIYAHHIEAIEGWMDFLNDLKQAGFKTGVATSAPRANLEIIMNGLGFKSKMESILASEDVKHHKPHPEVYLRSAENLGVDPSQCVVFEDSFSGVTAGLASGAKVVGVLSSHTKEELPPCSQYIIDYNGLTAKDIIELMQS